MSELTKQSAVETVIAKRFGKKNPEDVEEISEINLWYSADDEVTDMGICVELKFEDGTKENYQVNAQGVVYSWGDSPIIDQRSQEVKLNLEVVYKNLDHEEDE